MADYVWRISRERIARAVRYNPGERISGIMRLARVMYPDVHRAIGEGLIESDGYPIPRFVITEKGEEFLNAS